MEITIRPFETLSDYTAAEQIQREAWGLTEDREVVPDHMLLTFAKNGGVMLGAFETHSDGSIGEQLGFVCGFVGLLTDGSLKHCSHMMGIRPAYWSDNIGYRLKLAQRNFVLQQGMKLITWTFDPLETRNAKLNIHKLGAVCSTYIRNIYGDTGGGLNSGLESDRFQVDWHIASSHVVTRLAENEPLTLAIVQAKTIPLINPAHNQHGWFHPTVKPLSLDGDQLLLQVPANFQAIKAADMGLARIWRQHTRDLFEAAFSDGYVVIDFLYEDGLAFYLLQKGWQV